MASKIYIFSAGKKLLKVMGGKPRIPRKIKKAITHPCAKSKWLAKSKFFNNRLWGRYCDRSMIGEHKFSWYGVALYPNRKYGRIRYLDEKNAMYLYKRLGEKIKEKAVQLYQRRADV